VDGTWELTPTKITKVTAPVTVGTAIACCPQTRRPLSMRSLIDQAVEQGVAPQRSSIRVDSWMHNRNQVVHSAMPASRGLPAELVNGVMELVAEL
jgi:hypothetical protein